MKPLLESDISFMLSRLENVFRSFRGVHFFVTGATGLFGKWILETLLEANTRLKTEFRITALSRNPKQFEIAMPHLAQRKELVWIEGNAADFQFPTQSIDFIIHAAADVFNGGQQLPSEILKRQIQNTEHILELCRLNPQAVLLFTSSGAVYGKIPSEMSHVPEEFSGAPDVAQAQAGYGEGKRVSELLLASAAVEFGLDYRISRTFAVIGAHLPLDSGFAIGNFIRDALLGKEIIVSGDGTPTRSYLHMAEHTVWLFKILLAGTSKWVYNVGSDLSYSIAEIAHEVSQSLGHSTVKVLQQANSNKSISRYVPSIHRIKQEFGLEVEIPLGQAIQRTAEWWRSGLVLEGAV